MIKNIQYLAEADHSRVLVPLTSRLPSRTSLVEPCCSALNKTTRILQPSSPNFTQGPHSTGCGFSAAIDPILRSVLADICRQFDSSAKLFAYLVIGTFGSSRSTCHKYLSSLQQPPEQSTLNSSPPRFRYGEPPTKTPFLLNYKTNSERHSVVLEDISKSTVTSSPVLVFWANTPRFQRIATTLADLNAEGLNAQTVNDLLTMHVGAATQHVLRMSFVPEQEAHEL